VQLGKAIGINRTYLSTYFSQQGINYNAYINRLRITHFEQLYHEAMASQQSVTAQQLAHECGFKSYSTFAIAFKQFEGQTVTAWMKCQTPDL
jgi:AraC-like DNA-binding protein